MSNTKRNFQFIHNYVVPEISELKSNKVFSLISKISIRVDSTSLIGD